MNSYNGHSSKTHSITANNTPILNSLSLYTMKRKEWPGNEITQMLSFTPFQYAGFGMFVTSATHLLSVCYRYVTIYAWFCVINYHRLNVLALGILLIRFQIIQKCGRVWNGKTTTRVCTLHIMCIIC